MSSSAYLDGSPVFGYPVHVVHTPRANQHQINDFFGINGNQTLFGGTRGRIFMIEGLLNASDPSGCAGAEQDLLSFADGRVHQFADTYGRTWPNVIFRGEYTPSNQGPKPNSQGGWSLPYKCILEGLT